MVFSLKISKNLYGFSVTEILVVAALVGIIGAGLASVMTSAARQQKGIQAKDQQREFTSELRLLLTNKVACANTFKTKDPSTSFPVNQIFDDSTPTPVAKFQVGTTDKTGFLKIDEFRIQNFQSSQNIVDLVTKLSKSDTGTGTAVSLQPDIITLKVKLDGSGKILECFSIGTKSDSFWMPVNNSSSIYFSGGNVGIGTDTPKSTVQIAGDNILSTGPGNNGVYAHNLYWDATDSSFKYIGNGYAGATFFDYYYGLVQIFTAPKNLSGAGATATVLRPFTIANNGFVGIGTTPAKPLHVHPGTNMNFWIQKGTDSLFTNGIILNSIDDTFSNQMPFEIAGSPIVLAGASGKVAIGNGNPRTKLHVSGDTQVEAAEFGAPLTMRNMSNGNSWRFRTYGVGTIDANLFLEYSNGDINANPSTPYVNSVSFLRDGKVGIGTTNPRTALDVPNGTISSRMLGDQGATSPLCYNGVTGAIDACGASLRKFKDDIRDLDVGLEELLKLRPVTYIFKATQEKEMGFIAEEITAIDSRLGLLSTARKLAGVKYEKITSLITKAIQEFHALWIVDHRKLMTLEYENKIIKKELCRKDPSYEFCRDNFANWNY